MGFKMAQSTRFREILLRVIEIKNWNSVIIANSITIWHVQDIAIRDEIMIPKR
jgi:hypothetical protein